LLERRAVFVTIPPLLSEIIIEAAHEKVRLELVGEISSRDGLAEQLPALQPDLVLVGLRAGETDEIGAFVLTLVPASIVLLLSNDVPGNSPYPLDQARAVLGRSAIFVWNFAASVEIGSFFNFASGNQLIGAADQPRSGGMSIFAGDTTFNDNEVLLDGPNLAETALTSAVAVLSFGDVSFEGNQCNADLGSTVLWLDALVLAWSPRVADNRFQETFGRTLFSAVTLAPMNCTTDNQGTHCFVVIHTGAFVVSGPNRTLIEQFPSDNPCVGFVEILGRALANSGWKIASNQ
jgi:hypothetical protein